MSPYLSPAQKEAAMSPLLRVSSFIHPSRAASHLLLRLLLPVLTASLGVWLLMRALTPVAAAQPALIFGAGSGQPFSPAEQALFQTSAPQAVAAQAVGDELFTLAWSSAEAPDASSVAWGDYDGDGDLDLLTANSYGTNGLQLYRNDEGSLIPNPVWESDGSRLFISAAWGDYDGDGDLDLAAGGWAAGSFLTNSEVYRNDNGSFTLAWTDPADLRRHQRSLGRRGWRWRP